METLFRPKHLGKILLIILSIFILNLVLFGCKKKSEPKTILVTDYKSEKSNSDTNFEISNLVKVEPSGTLLGWFNNNEIITLNSTDQYNNNSNIAISNRKLEIRVVDYKSKSYKKICENTGIIYAQINNDKKKLAYISLLNDNTDRLIIKDIPNMKETSIGDFVNLTRFSWSNNGQYIIASTEGGLIIYDCNENKLREISISNLRSNYSELKTGISDDGKTVLIQKDTKIYILDLDISNKDFNSFGNIEKYISINNAVEFSFINNNEFIYLGGNRVMSSLNIYNIINNSNKELVQDVGRFSLSKDHKYILYEKSLESNLYISKLENQELKNEILVYKGNTSSNMFWNDENKKVLFYSVNKSKDAQTSAYVLEFK